MLGVFNKQPGGQEAGGEAERENRSREQRGDSASHVVPHGYCRDIGCCSECVVGIRVS